MALSFDEYARQLQSGKSAVPTIKAPASATSIGGLSVQESPFKPQWDFAGYNDDMYTFKYRNPNVGGSSTMYGYNPSMKKWYSNYTPAPTGPNVQSTGWKGLDANKYQFDNTGMLQTLADPTLGGYFLKNGSLYRTWRSDEQGPTTKLLYEWKPKPDPYIPPTPDPDPDPDPPPDPNAYEEYLKQLEAMKAQYEAQLKAMQDASAARQAEADAAKAAAEKQGRIADRTGALQQSGLWDLVNQMYGGNTDDLNSYLDTGAFSRRDALADWGAEKLSPLSQDLQKQYAKAISGMQQKSANAGFGDASWMRNVEGSLRQQQRGLADLYGTAYSPDKLYEILSGTPEAIRGVNWAAPQSVSSYGNGFDAFAALDPTLSGLIPGGMDETPQAWISTDYKSKNPWSAIFGTGADEDDRGKQNLKAAQGFLKTVLGL